MKAIEEPALLRVAEAAALMSVSRSKAYELARGNVIPTVIVGRSIRVPRVALLRWLDRNTRGGESVEAGIGP